MTFASNVAPRRIIRPAPQPWTCRCVEGHTTKYHRINKGYLARCPVCKAERPS